MSSRKSRGNSRRAGHNSDRDAGISRRRTAAADRGVIDRVTVVRSMSHPYPVHGVAYATSGLPDPRGVVELAPRDPAHWPFFGSVVDYLAERSARGPAPAVPHNIAMPWPFSTRRAGQPHRAAHSAAFSAPLTIQSGPISTAKARRCSAKRIAASCRSSAIRMRASCPNADSRFPTAGSPEDHLTLDRLDSRRSLLDQMERARRQNDAGDSHRSFDRYRGMAYSLLTSSRLREAMDLRRVPRRCATAMA